jgi:CubicO group peptidase (beta-lactamase class C family)
MKRIRSLPLGVVAFLFSATAFWSLVAVAGDPAKSGKDIAAVLKPYVDKHSLAGAVTLVADKDKILSLEAVGFADIENSKMMRPDAVFWIASQSKPITAAGLMLLVDKGKVNVDDPVENYLPEFKGMWVAVEADKDHMLLKHPRRPITIRDILTHTSGMPYQSAMERPTLDGLTLKDAVRSYAMTPLLFEPGTKFQYSNCGINTAGRIIEVVSGMPYEEFMEKRLFEPLGMKDTTFWPNAEQMTRLAKTYKPSADKKGLEETKIGFLRYPFDDRKRHIMPAGGYFSTASDVARFCQMMLGGGTFQGKRLLSEAAVKEMTTRHTPEGLKESWGLGWTVGPDRYGHGGAMATDMTVDTKRGLITIFLVQHAGFPGDGGQSQGAFRKAAEEKFGAK